MSIVSLILTLDTAFCQTKPDNRAIVLSRLEELVLALPYRHTFIDLDITDPIWKEIYAWNQVSDRLTRQIEKNHGASVFILPCDFETLGIPVSIYPPDFSDTSEFFNDENDYDIETLIFMIQVNLALEKIGSPKRLNENTIMLVFDASSVSNINDEINLGRISGPAIFASEENGCGSGGGMIEFTFDSPPDEFSTIPEFYANICRARGQNIWDKQECGWTYSGTNRMRFSGVWLYRARFGERIVDGRLDTTKLDFIVDPLIYRIH
jgi:hypothetical protein